jgi:hypothetical protein
VRPWIARLRKRLNSDARMVKRREEQRVKAEQKAAEEALKAEQERVAKEAADKKRREEEAERQRIIEEEKRRQEETWQAMTDKLATLSETNAILQSQLSSALAKQAETEKRHADAVAAADARLESEREEHRVRVAEMADSAAGSQADLMTKMQARADERFADLTAAKERDDAAATAAIITLEQRLAETKSSLEGTVAKLEQALESESQTHAETRSKLSMRDMHVMDLEADAQVRSSRPFELDLRGA